MTSLPFRVLVLVVAISFLGCSGDDGPAAGKPTPVGPAVELGDESTQLLRAAPQRSDGTHVLVERVVFGEGEGYVAIHEDGNGAPGRVLGTSKLLGSGTHDDVVVTLSSALPAGATAVWPVVHLEDNGNSSFDYPDADQAASLDPTGVVTVKIAVTVD